MGARLRLGHDRSVAHLRPLLLLFNGIGANWELAVADGHILARLIPNARLEIIDDGHLFFLTRPVETAGIIERFLASDDVGD